MQKKALNDNRECHNWYESDPEIALGSLWDDPDSLKVMVRLRDGFRYNPPLGLDWESQRGPRHVIARYADGLVCPEAILE